MDIKKAVNRLTWRLQNGWKANENDVEAINVIIEFVNSKHNQQLEQNELFAKLYIALYGQLLSKYNTTVFDDIPRKELHQALDKPLSSFIQRFTNRLNESELYVLFNELGIKIEHPVIKIKEQKYKDVDKLEKAVEDPDKMNALLGDLWKYDDVSEILLTQVNKAIDTYGKK